MLYKLLNLLFKQLTTIAHKLTVKAYNKEKFMAGKRVEYLKKVNKTVMLLNTIMDNTLK